LKIVVIDYGLGNLTSVHNALKFLKGNAVVSSSPHSLDECDKIVLPGVGSFGDAMLGLKERGLIGPLKKNISSGKPYLGICLGLQILFEKSEEGNKEGLGIFKGSVKRFSEKDGIKVPQIGWNRVNIKSDNAKLMQGVKSGSYFYFDHSYYGLPEDKGIVAGTTCYGLEFASMIEKKNINALQFHPERSQELGLRILANFMKL